MIEIKNLYLSFTKEYYALKNINLDVADGEKVALIGEADSGKTMLLRVLAKLEKYKSGEIYIKNINIKKINFKQDIQVGFVPSRFVFLENKTLKENFEHILKIRNFDPAAINLKVLTALKNFDIESCQNLKIKNLSPFQKIMAELARVSLRKVELFLIDDVCSLITETEREKVLAKLKEMMTDYPESTFVFAFSDEELANALNLKKIMLKDGEIVSNEDYKKDAEWASFLNFENSQCFVNTIFVC